MNQQPTTYNRLQGEKSSDRRFGRWLSVVGCRSLVVSSFGWLLVVGSWFPLVAVADEDAPIRIFDNPNPDLNFTVFAERLGGVANRIIPFLIGVALVVIIWGIFKYIQHAGDVEKVAEGQRVIVYGIVALFLMLSFWGFVMIIKNSLFG